MTRRVKILAANCLYSGIIGMGAGSLSLPLSMLGKNSTFMRLTLLSSELLRTSSLFRFMSACGKDTRTIIGDGRIEVADVKSGSAYDLLVVDAFSSGFNSRPSDDTGGNCAVYV